MSESDIDVKRATCCTRLRRLLQPKSGRCFVVALDHGFFAVPADLPAIEDLGAVLEAVTAVGPDGVLMSAGQARLLAGIEGRPIPALAVRGDVTNLYLSPDQAESDPVDDAALRAIRLDAVALLINLLDADDDPSVRQACLRNVFAAKAQCEHFGLPLMVEPIPFERRDGRYHDVADDERLVRWCARPSRPAPTSSRPGSSPTRGRCAGRSASAVTCPTSPVAGPRVTTAPCSR